MGCLFFKEGGVTNFAEATQSDTQKFAAYFAGMLERGVYLAPSQFEAMFISAAHSADDLEATLQAGQEVLEQILG